MPQVKFKTNIKCSGCLAKVTPFLNNEPEIENWEVNIYTPEKTLTVKTKTGNVQQVIEAVKLSGFIAEEIKE